MANQRNQRDEEEEEEEFNDSFFESFERVPSGVSLAFSASSSSSSASSDDDDDDDVRFSFASAVAPPSFRRLNLCDFEHETLTLDEEAEDQGQEQGDNGDETVTLDNDGDVSQEPPNGFDYGLWMADPLPVKERRRKLLQGLGLSTSRKMPPKIPKSASVKPSSAAARAASSTGLFVKSASIKPTPSPPTALVRSRSETRSSFIPSLPAFSSIFQKWGPQPASDGLAHEKSGDDADQGVFKIKNLDTGKEFLVSANGVMGELQDPQTGRQLSFDEFEKVLGYSPIVKEVMRRTENSSSSDIATAIVAARRAFTSKASITKSISSSKKVNWLKNIKFLGSSVEREDATGTKKLDSNGRLKVHQQGKSHKELTGLYMCQEIQAHEGSIWTMKFSCDSRYLASAGEDTIVHVWQVVECDRLSSSLGQREMQESTNQRPPLANGGSLINRSNKIGSFGSKRTKKGKGSSVPEYVVLPETIFSLSKKPFCSFEGHLDDVLDLSWSKSKYLLSSSMDKTVRLWDIETKACLKLFAHNDYVTCIQFNPTDESYFISGSLDAKVRLWSIPARKVVDWSDLHEMVTAACYTPDGQGALVGSHKGSCRVYNTSDIKLSQENQLHIRTKRKKSTAKKITGFQFAPDNPSEVFITSADSQIRVFDGEDMIRKFRGGFRNSSSQISASCTLDGKYVVCASEDSHVYIWKRDGTRATSGAKGRVTTRSHEHFFCKDVSVAIPWPNGGTHCEPSPDLPSWSRRQDHRTPSNLEDIFHSSRSHKKSFSENTSPCQEGAYSPSSFVSASTSLQSGHSLSPSISASITSSSSLSSWGWGSSNRITSSMEAADAWGLVVVTAGLGGNIRVYQNFGLPLRLSRQPNLF